jgi:hypothetical protein
MYSSTALDDWEKSENKQMIICALSILQLIGWQRSRIINITYKYFKFCIMVVGDEKENVKQNK